MNILIAPDKFKGTLTAQQVCEAIQKGLPNDYRATLLPMADGGEGSLEVIANIMEGQWREIEVNDPLFRKMKVQYYLSENTAYIEMSKASGLALLKSNELSASKTTTYGTGEMILDAIKQGVKKVYLFIGGSATNDGGIGMAAALGYAFIDKWGNSLKPIGENLGQIDSIIAPSLTYSEVEFVVVCDVINPFYGKNGATMIYGPQKGATGGALLSLEEGMKNLANVIKKGWGVELEKLSGSGAAGGLGGGAVVFLGATIESGTKTLIEISGLEEKLRSCDLLITGEGKFDAQSVNGKLIDGLAALCMKYNKPLWVICGISEFTAEESRNNLEIEKVISLVDENTSAEHAMSNGAALIQKRICECFC